MMNNETVFRCGLDITGTEHGEWQGVLRTDDGAALFGSVLELLNLLQAKIGPDMPDWEKR
jgi:hypothetical protein